MVNFSHEEATPEDTGMVATVSQQGLQHFLNTNLEYLVQVYMNGMMFPDISLTLMNFNILFKSIKVTNMVFPELLLEFNDDQTTTGNVNNI